MGVLLATIRGIAAPKAFGAASTENDLTADGADRTDFGGAVLIRSPLLFRLLGFPYNLAPSGAATNTGITDPGYS
jgi:hypothetical protein